MDIMQNWIDKRLAYDKITEAANDTFIVVRSETIKKIWTPDIYFENEKTGYRHTILKPNEELRIYANGSLLYSLRSSVTFSCYMNLVRYPMDTQTCSIRLGSCKKFLFCKTLRSN